MQNIKIEIIADNKLIPNLLQLKQTIHLHIQF